MNRKIIISLFAIPLALLFINASLPGGGKGGPKNKKVGGTEAMAPGTDTDYSQADMPMLISELKAEMETYVEHLEDYDRNVWPENLDDYNHRSDFDNELQALVEEKMINPLLETDMFGSKFGQMFSRCPSGMDYRLADNGDDTFGGLLTYASGCTMRRQADFLVYTKENTVKMKISDKIGYVPVDLWIKVRKNIES